MVRTWIPVSILLVLGMAVTLFLWKGSSPNTPTQDPAETTVVQPTAAEVPVAADATDLVVADPVLERVTLDLPEAGPTATYGEPVEEGILVTVVDGSNEELLPTAEVMVLDTGVVDERALQMQLTQAPDFEALFRDLGITYRTNDQAQVMIPEPIGDLVIAGRTDTHFNFAFDVDTSSGELTLRLNPIELLAIKVVDGAGHPVEHAPVSLRTRSGFFTQDLMRELTDQDGIARLKLFDLLKTMLAQEGVFAALLVLTPEPVEVAIDFLKLPEEPPVLVLPEVGQVEVRVVDEEGKASQEDYLVDLAIIDPTQVRSDTSGPGHWEDPLDHITAKTHRGIAPFPLVAFDQHLKVAAVSMDGERKAEVLGPGPVRGGGKISFTLAPKIESPILIGRVVNTEGMVGRNLNLESKLESQSNGNRSSSTSQLRTDEDGRFRMVLEEKWNGDGTRALILGMKATKRKPRRELRVELNRTFGPGEHELGDLVLEVPPLLASGVIFGADEHPLPGANVRPEIKTYYGKGQENFYWNGIWNLQTDARKDGSFEIRGSVEAGEYRLLISDDEHLATYQDIVLGQAGIQIHLDPAIIVVGRLLLDPEIDPESILVQLIRPENPNTGPRSIGSDLDKTGGYSLDGQEAGTASLRVLSRVLGEELYRVDSLSLQGSGEQKIQDIDLRGRLTAITLRVVDEKGTLLKRVMVRIPPEETNLDAHDNPLLLVTAKPFLSFTVLANAKRSVYLENISQDQEVVLRNGIPVTIQIDNMGAVPVGWKIHGSLLRRLSENNNLDYRNGQQLSLDDSGLAKLQVPETGSYQLTLSLEHVDDGSPNSSTTWGLSQGGEDMSLEVQDLPGGQLFHMALDNEALQTTMESILEQERNS